MSRKGFTLVELLVVVAILGLLVAVLFPVFAHVRENGRRTVCLSNERQIGMAIFQYAQDNNGLLPWGSQMPAPKAGSDETYSPSGEGWAGQVFPFVTDAAVFRCPDDDTSVPPDDKCVGAGCRPAPGAARHLVSYGLNGVLLEADAVQGRLADVPQPAKAVLLFEVSNDWASVEATDEAAGKQAPGYAQYFSAGGDGNTTLASAAGNATMINPTAFAGGAIYATGWLGGFDPSEGWHGAQVTFHGDRAGRHAGGSNFLLADGHARWFLPEEVLPHHRVTSQQEFGRYAATFAGQYIPPAKN